MSAAGKPDDAEEAASFSGWDFSHLDGRWQEGGIPWDYGEIVREFLQDSMELLDMGTGGGEFLLYIRQFRPQQQGNKICFLLFFHHCTSIISRNS